MSLNEQLPVGQTYLEDALADILAFGLAMSLAVADRLFPGELADPIIQAVESASFRELESKQGAAAAHVYKELARVARSDQRRLYAQVNRWIGLAQANGIESIQRELEAWDTSAADSLLAVAKTVLTKDYDRAVPLIRQGVERGAPTVEQLAAWPLFEWMRREGVMADLLAELGPDTDPLIDADADVEADAAACHPGQGLAEARTSPTDS